MLAALRVTHASLLALALLACAGGRDRPLLPFDLRPAMAGVRADAAAVAQALARGQTAVARDPARRLAALAPFGGAGAAPEPFRRFELEFRRAAAALDEAVAAGDAGLAARRFDHLLDSCQACHARFRPGRASGAGTLDIP